MEVFKTVWAQESARAKRKEIFELRAATTIKNNPPSDLSNRLLVENPPQPKVYEGLTSLEKAAAALVEADAWTPAEVYVCKGSIGL